MTNSDLQQYIDACMANLANIPMGDKFASDESARKRLHEILNQVCDASTVFPTIASDGERGVDASWHALQYTVCIAVSSDKETWCTLARPRERSRVEPLTEESVAEVKRYLTELSAFVKEHNPEWRTLFPA